MIIALTRRATTIISTPYLIEGEGIVWLAVKLECEYRSLSSYFSSGKNLIEWCFRGSERAIAYVNSREVERIYDMGDLIQQTINQEDKGLAEMICKDFGIELA